MAADGEASDDDAYEGGLTAAVQLTVATDDDQSCYRRLFGRRPVRGACVGADETMGVVI